MTHRQKLACSAAVLAALSCVILFAGFFAPYDFAAQNRDTPFASPTTLHFVDARGTLHIHPFVYAPRDSNQTTATNEVASERSYPLHWFVPGTPYTIAGLIPSRTHLFGVEKPARIFLMGSDAYGRDQFSRFLYGGQISLLAGLIAA
ncbi:MAG: hypothetical protein WCF88_16560, partial [Candidatus Acidiferrales bacterium]